MNAVTNLPRVTAPGMPPAAPLPMPTQALKKVPQPIAPRASTARSRVARLVTFGGAVALTAYCASEMISVVSAGGVTPFEGLFTALFVINFAWIALAAATAITGLVVPQRRPAVAEIGKLKSRTALVMPVYNESPSATAAALEVMARGLGDRCQAHAFEIVLLSDSRSANAWIAETQAVDQLSEAVGDLMPVWYRRRWRNSAKKAGNVGEFVERWGGRYDHMIVLDADSLLAPETLVALVAEMEADPRLGLLQTPPALFGGTTLFARLQQFSNRLFGPVVSRGLAAWSGSDGNYWGHNAIIRTRAFADCCGLPELSGRPPFGGHVMSHDFVEAAFLRRAGWKVEMADDLPGSWEGTPPSLGTSAARDRRWAQGNLQHAKVIGARGFGWPSRVHMATGIMSYLTSPLWLLLITSGVLLTVQANLTPPQYFPQPHQLFPSWPVLDSERMTRLFVVTLAVLLVPKAIGFAVALVSRRMRQTSGGPLRLTASVALELLLTALYAPVMMAIHTMHVIDILVGRDGGWGSQARDGETTWREAWQRHRGHMLFGAATGVGAWFVSPALLAWLSPMFAGFALSVPLAWASGNSTIGRGLRRMGLLLTEEETVPHPIFAARERALATYRTPADGVRLLARSERARETHLRWVNPRARRRGVPNPAHLTAAAKIGDAASIEEALRWLTGEEQLEVAGDRQLLSALVALPHEAHEVMDQPPKERPAREGAAAPATDLVFNPAAP